MRSIAFVLSLVFAFAPLSPAPADDPPPQASVSIVVDTSEVPDLDAWGQKSKALCEEWYPRIDPEKASYRDAYKTTAAFLAWIIEKHDPKIVGQLNQSLRKGSFKEALFKEYTGKDLDELWTEFARSLRAKRSSGSDRRNASWVSAATVPRGGHASAPAGARWDGR